MDESLANLKMKTYLYLILLTSLTCCLMPQVSVGQEAENEVLPAKLAIIAIGPKPAREFGNRNGAKKSSGSVLLPPNPGEIPPRRLYLERDEKEDGEENTELESIQVTFNSPSHFVEVPANRMLIFKRRGDDEFRKYVTVKPLVAGSKHIILLRPSGKGGQRWVSAPFQYRINLLNEALANKRLVVMNLSRRSITSIVHEDKKVITAGGFLAYEAIDGLKLHRVSAFYGREKKVIYHTAVKLNKEATHLLLYVFYDANPNTNDGRTVGLFKASVDRSSEKDD